MAEQAVTSGYKPIARGMARGVYQVGRGLRRQRRGHHPDVPGRRRGAGILMMRVHRRRAGLLLENHRWDQWRHRHVRRHPQPTAGRILAAGPGLKTMADLPELLVHRRGLVAARRDRDSHCRLLIATIRADNARAMVVDRPETRARTRRVHSPAPAAPAAASLKRPFFPDLPSVWVRAAQVVLRRCEKARLPYGNR